jgi:hypothetical protein
MSCICAATQRTWAWCLQGHHLASLRLGILVELPKINAASVTMLHTMSLAHADRGSLLFVAVHDVVHDVT